MKPRRAAPMKFEHRSQPLLPFGRWLGRAIYYTAIAAALFGFALGIGVAGYRWVAGLSWIDALLEASMILAGMGPVAGMASAPAKLFASAYAIFSGLMFIGTAGTILAPWIHRLLHVLHAEPGPAGKLDDSGES